MPPSLYVGVVACRDVKEVLTWVFDDTGKVRPAASKTNKVAVISEGASVTRTTLYETYASKVTTGTSYIIQGSNLRGQKPPFSINVPKETSFLRSAPSEIPQQLQDKAEELISPQTAQ
ncbi:hypothetical protein ABVT39_013545 [Epinephelus coioides]